MGPRKMNQISIKYDIAEFSSERVENSFSNFEFEKKNM